MRLHLEKKAIRALGVAESFSTGDAYSTIVGVVMRSDLVVDGFAVGRLEVSGSDATDTVISLFRKLNRNDVNVILLSGSVLSLYNIVDVESLYRATGVPVLALTFKKSESDLIRNVKAKFDPKTAKAKVGLLRKLGTPRPIKLKTGYPIYARSEGVTEVQTGKILDKFTLQGGVPEPVRVARSLAKAVASSMKESMNTLHAR